MRDWNFSFPWMSELHALFLTLTNKCHWHISVNLGLSLLVPLQRIVITAHAQWLSMRGKSFTLAVGKVPGVPDPDKHMGKPSSTLGITRNVTHRQSYAIAEWIISKLNGAHSCLALSFNFFISLVLCRYLVNNSNHAIFILPLIHPAWKFHTTPATQVRVQSVCQ